eukprot:3227467-Karenia_brevis.AAC.1
MSSPDRRTTHEKVHSALEQTRGRSVDKTPRQALPQPRYSLEEALQKLTMSHESRNALKQACLS